MPSVGALKAEIIFGLYLIHRHRAVRLCTALVLISLVALGGKPADSVPLDIVLGGVLGAVAGSRIVAPGAALNSVGPDLSVGWVVGARVFGIGVLLVPFGTVMNLAVSGGDPGFLNVMPVVGYGLISASTVAALAPWIGASGAGTVGVFLAWVGRIPPWALFPGRSLDGVEELVKILWVVAPMSWRIGVDVGGKGSGVATLVGTLALSLITAIVSIRFRMDPSIELKLRS
jgi:hypothetical protein